MSSSYSPVTQKYQEKAYPRRFQALYSTRRIDETDIIELMKITVYQTLIKTYNFL